MPQLTIIMPVYNAAAFVKEALDSILDQSFKDFELWIIDDASTDESVRILESIQDLRIKIRKNSINQGRLRTVNSVIAEVTSPYFTITDADDVSHPKRLQKQIDFLESHPDFMMCGASYWAIDEEGFLVREMRLKTNVNQLRKEALFQSQFLGPTTVMRKEVIDYFPEFYRHYITDNFADADLSCMILDKFKATNIDAPLYFYRIVRSSITRKKVTVFNLNLHRLVGFLSAQRRARGQDCLQRDAVQEADDFMNSIRKEYDADSSFFFRHQAFFHLYWGVNDLALENGWGAFRKRPLYVKNILSLILIVFRIVVFSLTRTIYKKHYSRLID